MHQFDRSMYVTSCCQVLSSSCNHCWTCHQTIV